MRIIRILVIGTSRDVYFLRTQLLEKGFFCSIAVGNEDIFRQIAEQKPDIILLEPNSHMKVETRNLIDSIKMEKSLPVILLLKRTSIQEQDFDNGFDDFIIEPYCVPELEIRVKRLLKYSRTDIENPGELIIAGGLVIDPAKAEVTIAGRIVILAFKEYELLKFLVNNRGRVFTRQALLDKVWGYDYFGGERTVDVHIRRLRAKIEDSEHSFIDTVRSIGYRFKEESSRE
jgi:two-component system, OmpR family, alkaline phosphatase synthesis response regulator PhoP